MLPLAFAPLFAAAPIGSPPHPDAIYGGAPVESCAWPSVVTIDEKCTGTLIHPEIVLYANHCGGASEVRFGERSAEPERIVPVEFCRLFDDEVLHAGQDWAFCKLTTAVTDVPIVPVLAGCETTLLTPGREVAIVGFGLAEDDSIGTKRAATTTLNFIAETGEVHIGGDGIDTCDGDSGGPAFVRLGADVGGDGSWRVLAVTSRGPPCGLGGYSSLVHPALAWLETESGVDVTPCTTAEGAWDPSPRCGGFPRTPDVGGASWANGCAGAGATTGFGESCGEAFVWPDDHAPPTVRIDAPGDGEAIASTSGSASLELLVTVEELESHVLELRLEIEGAASFADIAFEPPWSWALTLPDGEWTARVIAIDWAGNEGRATPVAFTIAPANADASTGDGESDEIARGCGCDVRDRGLAPWMIAPLWLVRRRILMIAIASAACTRGDASEPAESSDDAASSGSTAIDSSTSASTSTGSGATDDAPCPAGTLDCPCTDALACDPELTCVLQTCRPCPIGALGCACDQDGACDRGLVCAQDRCATFVPCGFPDNGECDEPEGTGLCLEGSDPDDCTSTGSSGG